MLNIRAPSFLFFFFNSEIQIASEAGLVSGLIFLIMNALYALTPLNQGYDPAGKLNVPFSNGNWIANSLHLAQSLVCTCVCVQTLGPRVFPSLCVWQMWRIRILGGLKGERKQGGRSPRFLRKRPARGVSSSKDDDPLLWKFNNI